MKKCSAFSVLCPGLSCGLCTASQRQAVFPLPAICGASCGLLRASVGLPRGQWMKHTRKTLPPSCVASVQRPGLWVLRRPVCFYLWPCSMMGCRKHTEEGPPVALPCFPVICQRASVPSCVKAPALACPGLPLVNRISFT